jgi:hypothetical protein
MGKIKKITALGKEISISPIDEKEYFCLNDMIKGDESDRLIKKWLRNRSTLDFLSEWEKIHNHGFNWVEFDPIRNESGNKDFTISVKLWIEKTAGKGIKARIGRYGGTWAHIDIAFHFAMWLSPAFHLAIIKDYQRLKNDEAEKAPWNAKRLLAKANHFLHTDAIRDFIIPMSGKPEHLEYASEVDLINMAVFGLTARQWEKANPELAAKGENMRDHADIHQLSVLANMESLNSMLISKEWTLEARKMEIFREAERQLQSMYKRLINKPEYLN